MDETFPSCKHVRVMNIPLHPNLEKEKGVNRVVHYFLIFALKQILWVLVEAASLRWF